jgi:hypothetical protein
MMWILEEPTARLDTFKKFLQVKDRIHMTREALEEFTQSPTRKSTSTIVRVLCTSSVPINNFINAAGPAVLGRQRAKGEIPSDLSEHFSSGKCHSQRLAEP